MTERTRTTVPALDLLLALRRKPKPLRVRTLTPEDLRQASGPVLDRLPLDRWHETVSQHQIKEGA